jgi:tetratricopeptide (TPR) repeat protein
VRRITSVGLSRAECLRRALEHERLGDMSPTAAGVALSFDQSRLWRSRALVADPETDPEAWRRVGFTAARQEDYKLAVDAYTEAIALTPMNSDLYVRRGHAYLALGMQRLQAYQRLRTSRIERRPSREYDCLLHPCTQALSDFSRAIELDPDSAGGYHGRGTVHATMGDDTLALADYSKAIDLDPNCVEAYRGRSSSYDRIGDKDRSAADAAKAKSLRIPFTPLPPRPLEP